MRFLILALHPRACLHHSIRLRAGSTQENLSRAGNSFFRAARQRLGRLWQALTTSGKLKSLAGRVQGAACNILNLQDFVFMDFDPEQGLEIAREGFGEGMGRRGFHHARLIYLARLV